MKSLIATVVLLSLVLILSVLNFVYVNTTADMLCDMLDTLPSMEDPSAQAAAQAIEEYWREKEGIIGLTVSYPFVDRISEEAARLGAAIQAKDLYGFESARTLLYDAAEDMRRAEQFSVKNLF